MSNLVVQQPPPSPDRFDIRGYHAERLWDVHAGSPVLAMQLLAAEKNVRPGAVFVDNAGLVPDRLSVCQALVIGTHLQTNESPSATSVYKITAIFDRQQSSAWGTKQPDPTTGEIVWTLEEQSIKKRADADYLFQPITNVVEEPFDPVSEIETTQSILVGRFYAQRTTEVLIRNALRPYKDRLNSKPFGGAERGCLLFSTPRIQPINDLLFLVELRMQMREQNPGTRGKGGRVVYLKRNQAPYGFYKVFPPFEGWAEIRPNRGLRTVKAGTKDTDPPSVRYTALLVDNERATEPGMLDDQGAEVKDERDAFYIVTDLYNYLDFAPLGTMGQTFR